MFQKKDLGITRISCKNYPKKGFRGRKNPFFFTIVFEQVIACFPWIRCSQPFSKNINQCIFLSHRFFIKAMDTKLIIKRAATIGISDSGDAVVVGGRGVRAALITTFCPGLIEPESV